MQQALSSFSTENFSIQNITLSSSSSSSPSLQWEYDEALYGEFNRKSYVKGLKRDITKDDLDNCKRFKESNTYFNFEGLSKELDDIELSEDSVYMDSTRLNAAFSFLTQFSDSTSSNNNFRPLAYFSLNNSCLHEISFEFALMSSVTPNACSTKLNSTDLDVLNISSCSDLSHKQRRITL